METKKFKTKKGDAKGYPKNIQLAKDIIAKKKKGIVYILEAVETPSGTQTQGMCMVNNVKHQVLLRSLLKAFQLDPAEIMATAIFTSSRDL